MASLDEWFMSVPTRFDAQAAGDMEATYCFKITGEGGGDYTVTIEKGGCKVERCVAESPDLTVTMSAADMAAIAAGALDPTTAFMTGRLQIEGDIMLAMKIAEVFLGK
jgi:putative sterol carrier protein